MNVSNVYGHGPTLVDAAQVTTDNGSKQPQQLFFAFTQQNRLHSPPQHLHPISWLSSKHSPLLSSTLLLSHRSFLWLIINQTNANMREIVSVPSCKTFFPQRVLSDPDYHLPHHPTERTLN